MVPSTVGGHCAWSEGGCGLRQGHCSFTAYVLAAAHAGPLLLLSRIAHPPPPPLSLPPPCLLNAYPTLAATRFTRFSPSSDQRMVPEHLKSSGGVGQVGHHSYDRLEPSLSQRPRRTPRAVLVMRDLDLHAPPIVLFDPRTPALRPRIHPRRRHLAALQRHLPLQAPQAPPEPQRLGADRQPHHPPQLAARIPVHDARLVRLVRRSP